MASRGSRNFGWLLKTFSKEKLFSAEFGLISHGSVDNFLGCNSWVKKVVLHRTNITLLGGARLPCILGWSGCRTRSYPCHVVIRKRDRTHKPSQII